MRARKKKILTKKVYSRVTPETYQKLDAIKSKYGFSSVYEIIQSLIHCFLRVADPTSDTQTEPVPYDIEVMFDEMSQAEKHVEFDKPKRRISHKSVNDE
ncbi:hypothetical protein [Bacteroides cellulosilyticus]|jgi:hypothetical protein|uniref:Uncharacterized protein n=1 Tax=Bacteroides cellulosilyticus TaxID=246787 RepID=A0A642PVC6_9BACE|nr:hypothetical protein [Bacteroides cellulosilyticus]KAA5415985.1 hypothetical protein F2Y81_16600 [Bacteroides cellulosilyticus]